MNRRDMLRLAATLAAISLSVPLAARADSATYQPELLQADLAAGKTVVLHFSATWCSTCQAQVRALDKIRAANPAYDTALTFMLVDWDTWKASDLTATLNVPARSVFVALSPTGEVGRLNNETAPAAIQAFLDQVVAAS